MPAKTLKQNAVAAKLKLQLKQQRTDDDSDIYLRLHRAISWIKASEENEAQEDIRFISLWIAFNACYAVDNFNELSDKTTLSEKNNITAFINKLIACDETKRLYHLIWNRFSSEIRVLLNNEYLFEAFWAHHRGKLVNYRAELDRSVREANLALSKEDVATVVEILLRRLYVLRNQIFHGGATYKGKVNRQQVKTAGNFLYLFVTAVVELMMANKHMDWGTAYYPVINQPAS